MANFKNEVLKPWGVTAAVVTPTAFSGYILKKRAETSGRGEYIDAYHEKLQEAYVSTFPDQDPSSSDLSNFESILQRDGFPGYPELAESYQEMRDFQMETIGAIDIALITEFLPGILASFIMTGVSVFTTLRYGYRKTTGK